MKTRDYSFDIPDQLIAQHPKPRGTSRLLVLDSSSGNIEHKNVSDFPDILDKRSVVVFNNTKVRKARLFAHADSGAVVEFLLLRKTGLLQWESLVSKSKKQKIGKHYSFPDGISGKITGEETGCKIIEFSDPVTDDYLERYGQIPLPPYIKRKPDHSDEKKYQTVYAEEYGSAAAPTAGLHFTDEIMGRMKERGIDILYVTLHVGIGTFLPIRTDTVEDHVMHREVYTVPGDTADALNEAKAEGRNIVAVGTTTVRTLESAWKSGSVKAGEDSTDLYIYPGYRFRVVNQMFTNFHTPNSSLLVMVSAFAGFDQIKTAYGIAVRKGYRFFSYGDAMLIC